MSVSVKICNCTYISHIISSKFHLSVAKPREPEDEQLCIAVHTINNIHDADPLDNSSNKAEESEHYLT